jgi:hypothetical protein
MSTATRSTQHPTSPSTPDATRRRRVRRGLLNIVLVVALAAAAGYLLLLRPASAGTPTHAVPQSTAMEKLTGVRFSRVAVVGDGGLVTAFYVVVDSEKATAFQSDRDHPPKLTSEERTGGTQRASIMRAGHLMRAGQTYYLVYENTKGAIRPGEHVSISYGGVTLRHVPVL